MTLESANFTPFWQYSRYLATVGLLKYVRDPIEVWRQGRLNALKVSVKLSKLIKTASSTKQNDPSSTRYKWATHLVDPTFTPDNLVRHLYTALGETQRK